MKIENLNNSDISLLIIATTKNIERMTKEKYPKCYIRKYRILKEKLKEIEENIKEE